MDEFDSEERLREKGYLAAKKLGYKLPPGVTMTRGPSSDGVAFYFRHEEIGELGRVRLVNVPNSTGARLLGEVVGQPNDPMTTKRATMLEPLVQQLHNVLDEVAGVPHRPTKGLNQPHQTTQEPAGSLMVKILRCESCDTPVARLIFASPETKTIADFHDVERRAFTICSQFDVPTWIIGPGNAIDVLTKSNPMNIRSTVMQIRPEVGDLFESSPSVFNQTLSALEHNHCAPARSKEGTS